MDSLLLKIVLTPLLIGTASLAGRRWGPGVSGWLVGLPFTSGPIAFFLALDHGTSFAARAALGIALGTISQAAFVLAYSWTAQRTGPAPALLAGCLAFGAATVALLPITLPTAALALAIATGLVVALLLMPGSAGQETYRRSEPDGARSTTSTGSADMGRGGSSEMPGWDLPARMVVATVFVVLLTGLAPALGPHLAGLLAPFPLYAAVLTVFAHRLQGAAAAQGVLRGLLFGLFGFATFFLVLASLLPRAGIAVAFGAAIVSVLAVQACTLFLLRRRRVHSRTAAPA